MNEEYDVIIVGAGPAGLFAAYELAPKYRLLLLDRGKEVSERSCNMELKGRCINCEPCDIMCGLGGAGTFSDGILNLRPDIGGDLEQFTGESKDAWELVRYVDSIFLKMGVSDEILLGNKKDVDQLIRRAAASGMKFIEIPQRHIGSENAPKVITNFANYLRQQGVVFGLRKHVSELIVENGVCKGVRYFTMTEGQVSKPPSLEERRAKFVLLAPGRVGARWMDRIVQKYRIKARYGPIDVGVRVEVPAIVMDEITRINRDPKIHIRTTRYDDFVRTFCTNMRGFVVKENYNGFIGTNGHSMRNRNSENTNFALLVRVELTEPVENTIEYGISIAKLATTIGGGKPIVQRFGDLRRGRRSTPGRIAKNPVRNTLRDVTPGDISMALPHRIIMDIVEGLEKLNELIPGVAADSTLLYAPEIKFYAMQLEVNKKMETTIRNLYVAGDGAGMSRDIVNAAATGILAARGIMQN